MYNIIGHRKVNYSISGTIIVASIVALFVYGLSFGIDFTGGSQIEIQATQGMSRENLQSLLKESNGLDVSIKTSLQGSFLIETKPLTTDEHASAIETIQVAYPDARELSFSSIGPSVGNELKQKAIVATILVFLGIIAYVSWAFRKSSSLHVKSWTYGVAAIIALFHDLMFVIGVFVLMGHFLGTKVDSLFLTALLTVLGFSVHDTIVVFDRIRERLKIGEEKTFEEVVNVSVNQTMVRSIATSMTVIFVLLTLLLFGGESIRSFVIALLAGMLVGTYSSIFVASPLLVSWYKFRSK